jgi:hypothetical protein
LRQLRVEPLFPLSEAFARFALDLGSIVSVHERDFIYNTAGRRLNHRPQERKLRGIMQRILRRAAAAGVFDSD